jgi:hypothetical protein
LPDANDSPNFYINQVSITPEHVIHGYMPGQPGAPGAGGQDFTQSFSVASTWTVNHNLNKRPAVTVMDLGGAVIGADILHLNSTQCLISFNTPQAGSVRCI